MGIRARVISALTTLGLLASSFGVIATSPSPASATPVSSPTSIVECATSWRLVKTDTFRGADALLRSQGVTTDGEGWIFSWQGGLSRTDDAYLPSTVGVIPPKVLLQPKLNPDGTNHLGGVHIGGIDTYNGVVYAPIEDTGYDLGVLKINDPAYQTPYMSLIDAHTMQPTGQHIPLDKSIHEKGVPWVAIDPVKTEAYTAEWAMNDNRLNVFDTQMKFKRFLNLVYPPALGPGFKLDRIQGTKIIGNTMFAARDDDQKTVYSIDLVTGVVAKRFSLNRPGGEIEGLTIRPTSDGALLHVLVILNPEFLENPTTGKPTRVEFQHWAPVAGAGCATTDNSVANPADVDQMLKFEKLMEDHIHVGHIVESTFGSEARAPGDVVGTEGWGDSGLWTGVYLGGQAMRYQVAKKHLSKPGITAADTAFWTAQKAEALARVRKILEAEHRDINIAEDWTGELRIPPDVKLDDPLNDRHIANFGGGIIKGEKGMIQRSCTPVGLGPLGIRDPSNFPDEPIRNNENRVFQITWKSGDGKTYNCETSPSRDTYAGLTFGLLTAFDMVGPDAPELRDQIRTDLLAMGNFLWKYAWTYPRPHGYVSVEHDFNGFFSPLFVYTSEARLNVANAVRYVANNGGALADQTKWNGIWAAEFLTQGAALSASLASDAVQPHDSYYKWNLSHLNSFNLLRTTKGVERHVLLRGIAAMDKTTRDDVNAHFEAITYAMTGEQQRLNLATTHLREWLDWRANVEAGPVHNSAKCGHTIKCTPRDHQEFGLHLAKNGTIVWRPGYETEKRALRPLPVAQRTPTDFLWQRSPDQLDGNQPKTHRMPAIDFLTPYWMLRYYTEVAPPAYTPFPEWPGPAHY